MTTTPVAPATPIAIPATTTIPALRSLLTSLAAGALTGLFFGALGCYSHALTHEYLMVPAELLITLFFSITLALLLSRSFNKLKQNSKSFTRLCTLLACIVAYYTAWIGWIATFVIYFSGNLPLLSFFTPRRIYVVANAMKNLGTWNLFEKPLNGTPLLCIWTAELLILFLATALLVKHKTKRPAK